MPSPESLPKRVRVSDLFETSGAPRMDEVVSQVDVFSQGHDNEDTPPSQNREGVLVIRGDDDPYWYRVDRYLSAEGFRVILRHVDAVEFRKLAKQDFTVVLFDWRRPTKRHREVLHQLKMLAGKHIVALYGEGLDGVGLRRLRVDDALAMPAAEDDLYRAVDDAIKARHLEKHLRDVLTPTPAKTKVFVALFILYSYLVIDGVMWREGGSHLLPDALFWVTLVASFPLLPLTLTFVWLYAASADAHLRAGDVVLLGWFAFSIASLWVLASLVTLRARPSMKVGYILALIACWVVGAVLALKAAGFY